MARPIKKKSRKEIVSIIERIERLQNIHGLVLSGELANNKLYKDIRLKLCLILKIKDSTSMGVAIGQILTRIKHEQRFLKSEEAELLNKLHSLLYEAEKESFISK